MCLIKVTIFQLIQNTLYTYMYNGRYYSIYNYMYNLENCVILDKWILRHWKIIFNQAHLFLFFFSLLHVSILNIFKAEKGKMDVCRWKCLLKVKRQSLICRSSQDIKEDKIIN